MPPSLSYSLASLDPRFRAAIEPFLVDLHGMGLSNYFKPQIGLRSLDKQCWAKCEGGSFIKDPSRGSHPNGFAIDFHATGPMASSVFKSKWTTGLDSKTHTQVLVPAALELWKAFGAVVAQHPLLEWGGNWKKPYTDKGYSRDQVLLGFDPYHVQLKGYAKYVTGPRYKCEGSKAVPLNKAEAAAAAVEESILQNKWLWAASIVGGVALWRFSQKR